MKTCAALLALLLTSSAASAVTVSVSAEQTTHVVVSSRNVNRITCDVPIQDVIWSKEQPVEVSTNGRHLFAKFLIRRTDQGEHLAETSVDLHVVCDDAMYTLLLQPRDVDTVTVQLGDPAVKAARASLAEWSAMPLEQRITRLTRAVFLDELPATARETSPPEIPDLWAETEISDVRRVRLPGVGLAAIDFRLTSDTAVTLHEEDFVLPELGTDILAVTVEPRELPAGGTARVILIERSPHDGT